MKTAILVDGGFYRTRAHLLFGAKTPEDRVKELMKYCHAHLKDGKNQAELYRIFYYDCPPLAKKAYHPFIKQQIDFSKSDLYRWMNDFFEELKKCRKLAIRRGRLSEEQCGYFLPPDTVKMLCNGKIRFEDLEEKDFKIDIVQKGVDMKIGIDIASLVYKKLVDQIILISGDSDFVPAAKLARMEGIDFILDPMNAPIKPDLFEHIDGLRTKVNYIRKSSNSSST